MQFKYSKFLLVSLLLFTALFIMASCSNGSDTETSTEEDTETNTEQEETKEESDTDVAGGEINVAFYQQPPSLDMHVTTSASAFMVGRHIYEGLMALNENYEAVPMLAESVDQSDDGLTYTFHLRQGITFHNGKEMIAEDVIASMERWREYSGSSELVFGGSTWEAKDDYTVVLTLAKPATGVLESLAHVVQPAVVMPKEVFEEADAAGVQEFIGTGPFEFVEWAQDRHIHLAKFDDYQPVDLEPNGFAGRKEALVDDIYFEFVLDASTRLAGLTTGQYDAAYSPSRDDYDQIQGDDNLKTYESPSGNSYLIFNKKEPSVFTDPLMRQAVNAALDVDEIMMGGFVYDNLYDIDHGFMSIYAQNWYTDAGIEHFNQKDPEKAKQLLEEAGYDGEELVLITDRTNASIYGMAVVVQEQLAEIGIPVKLEIYDWATISQLRQDPENWDFYVNNVVEIVIPSQILPLDAEWPGWADDPKLVSLHEDIISASSQEEAQEIWSELQEYAWSENLPAIKFGNYYSVDAARTTLEGVTSFHNLVLWNTKKVNE